MTADIRLRYAALLVDLSADCINCCDLTQAASCGGDQKPCHRQMPNTCQRIGLGLLTASLDGDSWGHTIPLQTPPLEAWAWISLALRCDVSMSRKGDNGIMVADAFDQFDEPFVLNIVEGKIITAFKFNTNGKVIATRSTSPTRYASVPSALIAGDELNDLSIAPNQKMRRHS